VGARPDSRSQAGTPRGLTGHALPGAPGRQHRRSSSVLHVSRHEGLPTPAAGVACRHASVRWARWRWNARRVCSSQYMVAPVRVTDGGDLTEARRTRSADLARIPPRGSDGPRRTDQGDLYARSLRNVTALQTARVYALTCAPNNIARFGTYSVHAKSELADRSLIAPCDSGLSAWGAALPRPAVTLPALVDAPSLAAGIPRSAPGGIELFAFLAHRDDRSL
jgi:hypothetical protein